MTEPVERGVGAADGAADAARYRRVAGAHLALAGAVNVACGAGAVAASRDGATLVRAFARLHRYAGAEWLLRNAPAVVDAVTVWLPVVGVVLAAAGLAQVVVGRRVAVGHRRRAVAASATAAANPLTLPLAAISVALLALSRRPE